MNAREIRTETRNAMEQAIVEYCEEQRVFHGDGFATEGELESIKADPMGFADLLDGFSTPRFISRVMTILNDKVSQEDIDEDSARWLTPRQ